MDRKKIGMLLRKKRKESGLRQKDLADRQISPATISSIERGIENVHPDKIEYLAGKLGVDLEDSPALCNREQQQEELFLLRLRSIEHDIDLNHPNRGLARLREIDLKGYEQHAYYIHYLKAKAYFRKDNRKKAKSHFVQAIDLIDKTNLFETNIKANSYNDLARISYYENNMKGALEYTEQGLKSFVEGGDREVSQHYLQMTKAICLEKLDRLDEAKKSIELLMEQQNSIKSIDVILNMYETYASILKKQQQFNEAIRYAMEGIEIAKINKKHDRLLDLWTILASIYHKLKEFEKAEICFFTALDLKDEVTKLKKENLLIDTYAEQGTMYLTQGKYDLAKKALEEAVRIGDKTKDARRTIRALVSLGDFYLQQHMPREAVLHLEKALKLTEKHGFEIQELDVLFRLCQCYKETDLIKFNRSIERKFELEVQLQRKGVLNYDAISQ
ncbi:helix-turn-helix transcriptional regulator [Lihuaxuella thermophila]|uniref:Tetratricopeptide repeat-containing protein n=1 Tax=Lihuaxuella thermophila TaxID=1173111 RepID=A0A1H8GRT8_9BACL|nr:helix-turn-helix transcriptional regulator [Lihuaxuella thermophila]SEN46207.1 Tetratricopeptide repeat-containing protein [Lihuaxuella thermophila]